MPAIDETEAPSTESDNSSQSTSSSSRKTDPNFASEVYDTVKKAPGILPQSEQNQPDTAKPEKIKMIDLRSLTKRDSKASGGGDYSSERRTSDQFVGSGDSDRQRSSSEGPQSAW